MKKELFWKAMHEIGTLLAISVAILGTMTLRFAIYAPELLNEILCTIGG